jgi:hypothetical protein
MATRAAVVVRLTARSNCSACESKGDFSSRATALGGAHLSCQRRLPNCVRRACPWSVAGQSESASGDNTGCSWREAGTHTGPTHRTTSAILLMPKDGSKQPFLAVGKKLAQLKKTRPHPQDKGMAAAMECCFETTGSMSGSGCRLENHTSSSPNQDES